MRRLLSITLWAMLAPGQVNEHPEAMAHARRAYDFSREGKQEEAAAELQQATRLAPANPLYHSALGGVYERQGRLEEARTAFVESLRLEPSNAALRTRVEKLSLDWGAALARERRHRAGLALARDTAARFPQSAPVQVMLGLFSMRNQQNIAAVAAYRRALDLNPESGEASTGLGIAQSAAGMPHEARATFEAGMKRFPNDGMLRQAYGTHLVKMLESGAAERRHAIEVLESALRIDPSLPEAYYQLGSLALAAEDASAAEGYFSSAARNGLDDARLHYAWARSLRRLGRETDAARHVRLFQARKAAEETGSQRQ
jgi:Flp pilus assembly protein TadD